MPDQQSASVPMQAPPQDMVLPPIFEQFAANLKQDRKKLLKDKSFSDPKQLQAFIGQYLYPRFEEMFRTLAQAFMESYGLGASNANEMRRLYHFTVEELQRLGSDVDHDTDLPGVSAEVLDDFQQAFYALGTLLQEKYPEDEEVEGAFNRCAGFVSEMVAELMQGSGYDGEEDEDDSGDEEDDDSDGDDSGEEETSADAGVDASPEPEPKKAKAKGKKDEAKASDGGEGDA